MSAVVSNRATALAGISTALLSINGSHTAPATRARCSKRRSVSRIERDRGDGYWKIDHRGAKGTQQLRALHLIDASGRSAWLSRRLGATRHSVDKLVGVVRWFEAEAHEPLTLIEAVEEGWWYSAPLPESGLVVAHLTDAALSTSQGQPIPDRFAQRLDAAPFTRLRLARPGTVRHRLTCLAAPGFTTWDASEPFLPVGDALVSFDPIAGQGLCFALRSALEAATVIEEARAGDPTAFDRYRRGARGVFDEHLRLRQRYYSIEPRWANAPFWRNRARVSDAEC